MSQSSEQSITKRKDDFSKWYQDVIDGAQLAEHGSAKGTMVIRPYGYAIWENMQKVLDAMFKETGVQNAYFPLFIPESFLKKEADHVEGFAPEVAVVTHAGGKKLEEPLIVRPTSETIINDSYSRWIQSYRDLPLLINQWANIVRWEMRPRLFLRTTEFLWQEGHTVHATKEDAEDRVQMMLDVYKKFVEEYLAMPVIAGRKSDTEKFAGADFTTCIEAMMQDKKALQAGTSHMLGQNFAKVFDVKFLNEDGEQEYGWQTSWGVSTRMIGGLIMTHSDDNGLVVPPKIAPTHAVIIPIFSDEKEKKQVMPVAEDLAEKLKLEDLKIILDDRDMRPGPRFFEWEKKGVPIRIEIGPKDIKNNSVVAVRRDTGEKENIKQDECAKKIPNILDDIQKNLFEKASKFLKDNTHEVSYWDEFKKIMQNNGGFISAYWCGNAKCEQEIKDETKATIRCIPFCQDNGSGKCVHCDKTGKQKVIFAKAY
ncbi:MAG: proline--tRNA ligase [Parcubacteria group bacterium CG_4_9_14_0_2_um_filter_41_8]|nr:MAG: proline--tRNA ligase [Parcubacteria group bacterium CG11_big_fil_rev_8_21_14_0_20_41_14]PJC40811.1 MAG: proline--tRNA ligase [Parcubacteria group bacterium CG_4_9_14_0_2_um_filter_41_8]